MRVLIVGCGIGGAAAALSLHRAGIDAALYESAASLRELGVGINVLPHATRELSELGLQDALAAQAIETASLAYHTTSGRLIVREPRGIAAGYRWPQFSVRRAALLTVLTDAVQARLGADCLHMAHRLVGFEQDADGVTAQFVDPASGARHSPVRGDLLIGADGIHSAVRGQLFPDEGPPKFTGVTMWRGVTEWPQFLDGRSMALAGNWHQRVVLYPISPESAAEGRSLINWVAEIRDDKKTDWHWDSWDKRGDKRDFLPAFADWRFDWLDVRAMMDAAETVFEFPMADRDPLQRWTFGRATLLGDAAHPMYPSGSNGAAQAIIDARVLAASLADEDGIEGALQRYERNRRPQTARIVRANRTFAAEHMLRLVDERCPPDAENIQDYVSEAEIAKISASYKRLAGFDPTELNARASYDRPSALGDNGNR